MSRLCAVALSVLLLGSVSGCASDASDDEGEAISDSSDAIVAGTVVNRSLAVTDPTALAKFSFATVMSQIRATGSGPGPITPSEPRVTYQRWMKTFGKATPGDKGCDSAGIDVDKVGLKCPRAPEAKLATVDPFAPDAAVRFVPVALFNRFDLTPADGANCGEHRIIYAMKSTDPAVQGRAFINFEGILPNPRPTLGANGCLAVAQFWQGLSKDANPASRAAKLENFYLRGTAIKGFGPVVSAANYGLVGANGAPATAGRRGQIRTNFFVDNDEWHLREFKLHTVCPSGPASCQVDFDHVPVKDNPAEELFAGTHPKSVPFQAAFRAQVASLARNDINGIRMSTPDAFNEFESVSQDAKDAKVVFSRVDNLAMQAVIRAELKRLRSPLTVDHILTRATTQTCAGCHQASSGVRLGGGLVWPASGTASAPEGFVHVDERGELSPALRNVFLPKRKMVLEKFINQRTRPGTLAAPIAGNAPGAQENIAGNANDAVN